MVSHLYNISFIFRTSPFMVDYIRLQKPIDYQEKIGVKARREGYPPTLPILIILIDSHLQILYIVPTKNFSVLKIVIKD